MMVTFNLEVARGLIVTDYFPDNDNVDRSSRRIREAEIPEWHICEDDPDFLWGEHFRHLRDKCVPLQHLQPIHTHHSSDIRQVHFGL